MVKCRAFTANGRPCKGLVRTGSDLCPAHDPAWQEARRRAASKAARSKPGGEIRALKEQLKTLADDVLARRVHPKAGAVVTQVANAYARLIELERRIPLKARLAQLEARVASLPDRQAERESKRLYALHFLTWATRGSFEDIPEKQRDLEMWESVAQYGPVFLGLIWEGHNPGREELLAAGVDFTLADDASDIIGAPKYGAPGPDTPRQL